jgi:small subunit ribosomal protein S9
MAEEDRTDESPQEGGEAPADEPEAAAEGEQADEAKQADEAESPDPSGEEAGEGEAEAPDEAGAGDEGARPDQPPGAELEPIAIEPERELSAEERARREAEAEERARREAEATAEAGVEEPAPREAPAVKLEGDARFTATGKRKSSIARVILLPGSGRVEVNKRELDAYFPRSLHQSMARQPLVATGYDGSVDVQVRVHGGGISGQAGAVRHGIARALVEVDPELRGELKRRGYLTRDARRKERRKAGLKKARKRPQFSKR